MRLLRRVCRQKLNVTQLSGNQGLISAALLSLVLGRKHSMRQPVQQPGGRIVQVSCRSLSLVQQLLSGSTNGVQTTHRGSEVNKTRPPPDAGLPNHAPGSSQQLMGMRERCTCSPSSSASWRIMKEKELHRISAMCPAADAGNRNGVIRSSPPPLPPPLDLRRGVALARRSSCHMRLRRDRASGDDRLETMCDIPVDAHGTRLPSGATLGRGAGQDAGGLRKGMCCTCKSRASRSDDSAWSIVLYDLLASAFCLAFRLSGLPSDANAMSAHRSHAQSTRQSASPGKDVNKE